MWLEKPHEEEVCAELIAKHKKLNDLKKNSELLFNNTDNLIDGSILGDTDDYLDLRNPNSPFFSRETRKIIDERKKRQAWWDQKYIQQKVEKVQKEFTTDNYM